MALRELLRELNRVPEPAQAGPDVLVTVFGAEQQSASARVADRLRRRGVAVELALIIGPDEAEAGTVLVKDLRRRQQEHLPAAELDALADRLRGRA